VVGRDGRRATGARHRLAGQRLDAGRCGRVGAHANSRFTAPAGQCPTIDPAWEDPAGVPISAFIFGGRLSKTFPLVYQAYRLESRRVHGGHHGFGSHRGGDWRHRHPPRSVRHAAVLRLQHGGLLGPLGQHGQEVWEKLPMIFRTNWFRKDANGKFAWPGYGQNMRVLKWIVERVNGQVGAVESSFGLMPRYEDLDLEGLDFTKEQFETITNISRAEAASEVEEIKGFFEKFGRQSAAGTGRAASGIWQARRESAGSVEGG
jgi:phosphoenolpyruvate carboxykinase (GTP)